MINRELFVLLSNPDSFALAISNGIRMHDDSDSSLPLLHTAAIKAHASTIRCLLSKGGGAEFVNSPDQDLGYPPIFYAAERGDIELVRVFLEYGANINCRGSRDDENILTYLVERAEPLFIRQLVELGANVNLTGSNGADAVQLCERRWQKNKNSENRELLEFLLSRRSHGSADFGKLFRRKQKRGSTRKG